MKFPPSFAKSWKTTAVGIASAIYPVAQGFKAFQDGDWNKLFHDPLFYGAALVASALEPEAMLALLKRIERAFGRRWGGQRWGSRVLDLDIVLWSGGCRVARGLVVPHPAFHQRSFVLEPARRIVPRWRDPLTGLTITHLAARLCAPTPKEN
jgi:2-amino-4-hydroxy-6-hydroxymethyldihydropteridine diphosphokinase